MNLLALRGVNPEKYSLALMDALFTDDELSVSCFAAMKRSTKTPLDMERVELLKGLGECMALWGEHERGSVVGVYVSSHHK